MRENVIKAHRVLFLEDNLRDRELLEATLAVADVYCEFSHASTRSEYEAALTQNSFDLIISDFSLPGYDGLSALASARKMRSDIPFIFVSGTIGEERAIEGLKNGATDYILKDRPDRLVSAVKRALHEAEQRRERQLLEEQLRQAQKMEAIGQLAGGVAHDFNNLLAVIQGNAELVLMNNSGLDDQSRECLKQVTFASERAANLTRQLLAFGRKQAMRLQPLNLNDVIANLNKMLGRVIGEDMHLQYSYNEHPPFVQADVGMIEQILLNLVVNGRDAMSQGGRLLITTRAINVDETYAQSHPEARTGGFICLSVSDTGCGIPPENMQRIFEPFFTTKDVGKGTGLGLATVYGIVKQHGGWVEVSSCVGAGTTFRVFLPAIHPPPGALDSEQGQCELCGGTETILLVEDDLSVRMLTRRVLENFGYTVIEAASGRQALEVWHGHPGKIDLLLTDVVLPDGINGRKLAEQLRALSPTLKVVFASGYSANVMGSETEFFRRSKSYFLQKPYAAHVLIETLRHCLDGDDMFTPVHSMTVEAT